MTEELLAVVAEKPNKPQQLLRTSRKRRRQPTRTNSYGTVSRPLLLRRANEYLARDGMLGLCSERGMGRHILAGDLAERHRMLEGGVCSVRISASSIDNSCRRLRKSVLESIEETQNGNPMLVVVEGVSAVSEAYTSRIARCIKLAVVGNCKVLIVADAGSERLFDCLPSCHVMRAQEMLVSLDEYPAWTKQLVGYSPETIVQSTHGIPALVATLKETRPSVLGMPEGQSWDRAAGILLNDALRPNLIEEEHRVRCAMAALGSGSVAELEGLGIRVSRDILEELAAQAPLFGADAQTGLFNVVPCDVSVVAQSLELSLFENSEFLGAIVHMLAERGNIGRAAALTASMEDSKELFKLVCEFPLELIDAGLANLVAQTIKEAQKETGHQDVFVREILAHIGASGFGVLKLSSAHTCVPERKTLELQIELLRLLAGLLSRRFDKDERQCLTALLEKVKLCESRTTRVLGCIVSCVADICDGEVHKAFRALMLEGELRAQTGESLSLLSAVSQLLYEMLHYLMGSSLTTADFAQLELADFVLEKYAPETLRKNLLAWRDGILALSNKRSAAKEFYTLLPHYVQRGQKRAYACVHLLAAFLCMPESAYRQMHVHVTEAYAQAKLAGLQNVMALSALMECKVLCSTGEQRGVKQMLAKGLPSEMDSIADDIKVLFDAYARVLAFDGEELADEQSVLLDKEERARLVSQKPRPEIRLLAQYIVGSDVHCGKALGESLPASWHLSRRDRLLLAGEAGERTIASRLDMALPSHAPRHTTAARGALLEAGQRTSAEVVRLYSARITISVLGSMAVCVDGNLISDSQWKRPQARSLLAQLALVPSHSLSRYEILEQLWPDINYERARERLYTTVSALRSALGQTAESAEYIKSEQGRLWLNTTCVECDVDAFEEACRAIIAGVASDEEVVAACMELEKTYRAGSYIPAKDPSGFFKQRHIELARRYRDALGKGVIAARQIGDRYQAQWFESTIKTLR